MTGATSKCICGVQPPEKWLNHYFCLLLFTCPEQCALWFCLKLKSILSLTGWNTFHTTYITDLDPLKYGIDGNHFRFWLYLTELYAVKGLHWSKEIHFNVFSKTSFSSCRNSALKRTFGAEQLEGRWVVGLLLPVPVHVEELKKLHRFRLCFVLLVNRSRAEGEAICKEKGASKLQESARQDENGSTFPLW